MAAMGSPVATTVDDAQRQQRADGHAAVLGIGTANPSHCLHQDEFPDWYFHITKSDHLAMLKAKMKRICEKSGIKKRHVYPTEEMVAAHPEILDRALPSLDARMRLAADTLPDVAAAAAARAIAEWGRPAADITHLVVSTSTGGAGAPSVDLRLAELLGLRPSVQRTMLSLYGCTAGTSALRVAKDLAENTPGARVLVVAAETGTTSFRSPDEAHLDELLATALFADGAGAAVVGAGSARSGGERQIFHMVFVSQTTLPATAHTVQLTVGEHGIDYRLSASLPAMVRGSIERCLADAVAPLGLAGGGWNDLFWVAHPGSPAILDSYEAALGLEPRKLAASRRVLSEYGQWRSHQYGEP
ncbi:unnamed protein product [Urochloa humidicola]